MTFYNRIQETKEILQHIGSQGEQDNKILLLAGKTGVGKSGLVRKILENDLESRLSICVYVSKSSPETIENLHYLNAIYSTLSQLAEKKHFDNIPSPLQHSVMNIKNLFRFGKDILLSKTIGDGKQLFEPVEEGNVLRKKDYIIDLLNKCPYIVNIQNIQNIDTQSLEILGDILKRVRSTTFIFEYTLNEVHSIDQFYSFYNELSNFNAQVFPFEIKMLNFNEAKKLAPDGIAEEHLKNLYQQSDGNLIKVILSSALIADNEDPIRVRLSSLTKDEHFLLYLLFLNGGEIKFHQICSMLVNNPEGPLLTQLSIENILFKLQNQKVIEYRSDGSIRIFHDSILMEIEKQNVNPIQYVAFNALKRYYTQKLDEGPDEDTVGHLFSIYLKFSDEELLHIFPYLRQIIKSRKYPRLIISKLVNFREDLTQRQNINYKIVYEMSTLLTTLCLELGLWEEAQKNLDLIYSNSNPYHRALQAAIYALDYTSLNKIETLVEQAEFERERLIIQICQLSRDMARQSTEQSAKKAKSLIENESYQSMFEYAYLLRNYAELVEDLDESIHLYFKSLKRFHDVGREDLCAQVLVSLSMIYAYKGQLSKAQRYLNKAEKTGNIQDRFLLNNNAVLEILNGSMNEKTIIKLNDALLITGDLYERLIVECNLLVCYVMKQDKTLAAQLCKTIEEQNYTQFEYEEFLHIVYQDLLYYHMTFGDSTEAERLTCCIRELINKSGSCSMAHRLAKLQLNNQINSSEFYSNFPYRVDFLGSWDFEISRDLEHCL